MRAGSAPCPSPSSTTARPCSSKGPHEFRGRPVRGEPGHVRAVGERAWERLNRMQLFRRQAQRLPEGPQGLQGCAFPLQHPAEKVPGTLRLCPGHDQRHAAEVALDDVTLLAREQRQLSSPA